jgi:twitching motility protein PilT
MTAALASVRLTEMLHVARLRNASDVHLTAGIPPVLRVDGALAVDSAPELSGAELAVIASAVLDAPAAARLEVAGDVTITRDWAESGMARIHAYRSSAGVAIAIRLLAAAVPSLESLHLPEAVEGFAQRAAGLVIVAGPTGSGKSTALAAIVNRINRTQARHVITIEDPIEYRYASDKSVITQREIGADVRSYADAVYGALRSDPDVILVGEMRDSETMHAALTAAETGHLVLTTLHTGDGPQTVDRILGAFPDGQREQMRVQLAQTLAGVVCLRLVPRAFARGRRCAAEVLVANDAVRHLIRDGKTHQLRNVIATNRHSGMQTLEMHLTDLVARREISLDAARSVTDRPSDIKPAEQSS